ncbi:MAG: BON domain-containing protein [Myxococcales bacterium]|nr:BON domain-containing protein [Myxococcales bacterium]
MSSFVLMFAAACSTTRAIDEQVSDAAITSKVKAKLAADPEINPFEIDVDTQAGKVFLSGHVDSETAMREAERLARSTSGVREVDNRLILGDLTLSEETADVAIGAKVKAKLAADPQVSALNIDVDVDRGVVTLKGVVRQESEREEAERLARSTTGVEAVRNLIEVDRS